HHDHGRGDLRGRVPHRFPRGGEGRGHRGARRRPFRLPDLRRPDVRQRQAALRKVEIPVLLPPQVAPLGARISPMRRGIVPGVPFVFSLLLSACTVGSHVFWQDSGYYLTAVRDFSLLYPHGFVLYLLLCKAWTFIAAPLFGFVLSVHLFSSLMAAGGAAFTALAARDFLRKAAPEKPAELPAILAACLLSAGYCYGHAAIIAKTYALFYLLLALLLWILVVADRK